MAEWCLAHPWMTLFIIVFGQLMIGVIFDGLTKMIKTIVRIRNTKSIGDYGSKPTK